MAAHVDARKSARTGPAQRSCTAVSRRAADPPHGPGRVSRAVAALSACASASACQERSLRSDGRAPPSRDLARSDRRPRASWRARSRSAAAGCSWALQTSFPPLTAQALRCRRKRGTPFSCCGDFEDVVARLRGHVSSSCRGHRACVAGPDAKGVALRSLSLAPPPAGKLISDGVA